ncbi:MAG: hypothetical protein HUJ42_01340 [Malacoplasma sp.]|nr:hypothetical protein [Malacoplasma sp.]
MKKTKLFISILFALILLVGIGIGIYFYLNRDTNPNDNSTNQSQNPTTSVSTSSGYVRSPYGAQFSINDAQDASFVVSYSHFDSPGVSTSLNSLNEVETKSDISGQGSQEVREANNISLVLDYFKNYFNNQNIIFMGDTNIQLGNQAKAFASLENTSYQMLFADNATYNTSFSTTFESFANPYDKFIYAIDNNQFSIAQSDSSYYDDIKSVVRPNFANGFAIDSYLTLPSQTMSNGASWIDYNNSFYSGEDENQLITNYLRYAVSDHLPVGFNLVYKNLINVDSSIRVGGWNALNFNLDTGDLAAFDFNQVAAKSTKSANDKRQLHAINLAKIIYNAKFDVIGLLEINKNQNETNLNYFLNYLNSLANNNNEIQYDAILSGNTPAINPNSSQVEEVMLIYNTKKLSILNSPSPAFYQTNDSSTSNMNVLFNNLKFIDFKYKEI